MIPNIICYFVDPKIHIFPCSRDSLCKENAETRVLEFKDKLMGYKESNIEYAIQNKKIKEIETRIYADLAREENGNEATVSKFFSLGYLKKKENEYFYYSEFSKHDHGIEIIAECSNSNIHCSLVWYDDRNKSNITNKEDTRQPIKILPTGFTGKVSIQNILLNIQFSKDAMINNQKITIKAKKEGTDKWSSTFDFLLYKNAQNEIKKFNFGNKPIEDFFVIPTATIPSANQRKIISELQKLNNQVLARNKKMGTEFSFLSESGELDKEQKLVTNIRKSIKAFKTSAENPADGCRSGTVILGTINNGIVSNYPYNFSNFGQDENLMEYLSREYIVDKETLQGIIVDKNYLFGNYTRGNPENEIEGVKNLYDYVVVPFINGMMQHAESYLNFNRRWLSCPKYNNLYQRGVYTIPSGKIKILYKKDGTTEMLTEGTKIHFKSGADKYAFDKGEQKHRYEVIKINSESCAGEVELTLEDKKNCDDSKFPQNYSNYVEIAKSVTNKNDKKALSIYKQSNGVPYYMNGMDSNNNKGARKLRADEILNWSEQEKNWYSYKKKTNTGDFGIDCSGFVSNCLTAFCYENKEKHFLNLNGYFQNYVRATSIRDSLCREIPITENTKGLSYLQKGDVVISSTHIAFSYEINLDAHLAMDKIVGTNKNYFTILQANGNSLVSNDDNKDTEASCLYLTTPPNKYTEGFFLRILKGPFRHWGVVLEENSNMYKKARLGRIYLWY